MILTQPKITLGGVDRKTNEPVINLTSEDAPLMGTTNKRVGVSLVFEDTNALNTFARRLHEVADAIQAGAFEPETSNATL